MVVGNAEAVSFFSTKATTATNRSRGRVLAVLVGVGKYRHPGINLNGPVNDVRLMQRLLADSSHLFFSRSICKPLIDEKATLSNLHKTLDWVRKTAGPDDVVFFSFSGHAFIHSGDGETRQ